VVATGVHVSGNHAFDEYRAGDLPRLEDEQKEFAAASSTGCASRGTGPSSTSS
jgi:hypothetical protein